MGDAIHPMSIIMELIANMIHFSDLAGRDPGRVFLDQPWRAMNCKRLFLAPSIVQAGSARVWRRQTWPVARVASVLTTKSIMCQALVFAHDAPPRLIASAAPRKADLAGDLLYPLAREWAVIAPNCRRFRNVALIAVTLGAQGSARRIRRVAELA